METNSESFKIFIAGGYGIVGSNIAKLVRKYYPQSHILIAGRTPDKGQSLVNELGNASTVMLNLKDDQVPEEIKIQILVHEIAKEFKQIDQIEMVANNDPDDLLGPLSVGDLDQEYGDVMLRNHGSWIKSKESREIIMADGLKGTGFPITIMDTAAVAGMTEAKSVRFEVSAEKSIGMAKTNTPSMDLYIEAKGIDLSGKEITRRVIASHPGGQAKCTAFGALLAIKTILSTTKKGFLFLEYLMDLDLAFKEMKDEGMEITFQ